MTKKLDSEKHTSSSIAYILNILKDKGYRQTSQRIELITTLDQAKVSLSVKDIFTKLKKQKIKIDEASVYRIIETLKELNIVHIHSNGKVKLCSHLACEQKFHLSYECENCGKVQEPHLAQKQEIEIAKILNLNLNTIRHLHVDHLCPNCAN